MRDFCSGAYNLHADAAANEQAGVEGVLLVAQQFSADRVIDGLREILTTRSSNPVINNNPLSDSTFSDGMKVTSIA